MWIKGKGRLLNLSYCFKLSLHNTTVYAEFLKHTSEVDTFKTTSDALRFITETGRKLAELSIDRRLVLQHGSDLFILNNFCEVSLHRQPYVENNLVIWFTNPFNKDRTMSDDLTDDQTLSLYDLIEEMVLGQPSTIDTKTPS